MLSLRNYYVLCMNSSDNLNTVDPRLHDSRNESYDLSSSDEEIDVASISSSTIETPSAETRRILLWTPDMTVELLRLRLKCNPQPDWDSITHTINDKFDLKLRKLQVSEKYRDHRKRFKKYNETHTVPRPIGWSEFKDLMPIGKVPRGSAKPAKRHKVQKVPPKVIAVQGGDTWDLTSRLRLLENYVKQKNSGNQLSWQRLVDYVNQESRTQYNKKQAFNQYYHLKRVYEKGASAKKGMPKPLNWDKYALYFTESRQGSLGQCEDDIETESQSERLTRSSCTRSSLDSTRRPLEPLPGETLTATALRELGLLIKEADCVADQFFSALI
jgi:hypothetical protein